MDAVIYRQLQAYFQNFFSHFDSISRISGQLNTVIQDFVQESEKIEAVAEFLNQGVQQQTTGIERCMMLIENFTQKVNAINESSQNMTSLAHEMEKTNRTVQDSIGQLVVNQGKNDEAMEEIFGLIRTLIERTQKIGEITNLINRISNETNLLGLNAKVEAVHAGAAGRGFSVVAEEIQRLSKDTKVANEGISDTIKSVTDEISLLERVALSSRDTFTAQRESVGEVSRAFERTGEFVSAYIREQKSFNSAIEEIKDDEERLAGTISNIFASVRNVSATANEITSLTYDQNNTISMLGKLDNDLAGGVVGIMRESSGIKVRRASAPGKKITIVFDHNNPFFDPTIKEAIKAAEIYNYDIAFRAPKSRGADGVKEMNAILDQVIEEKADGLVISPLDDSGVSQRLKQISRMGTRIVFINSLIKDIDYVSFIQTNGIAAGAAGARIVMGAMGNQGEVLVNSWVDTHISAIEDRKSGFVQELKKSTNIKVHEVPVASKPTQQETDTMVRSMLTSYPNARFVFLTNCDWGLLFGEYVRKHRPAIQVITVDYTKEIETAMSEGLIHYAIGQRNYSWGSMAFRFLDRSFSGKPVQKYVDTGTYEVNQQNMKIYQSMV
jgi:methyl-accepting chemotaxis protein